MVDVALHDGQLKVFNDTHRFRVLVCGRRWGKSRMALWELVLASLQFKGTTSAMSPETVLGVMPTLTQAKKVLWQPLVNLCETELAPFVKRINRSDFRIDFHYGKPSIVIAGANDAGGDRLRGMRLYFVVTDEAQDIKPIVFDEVILPAMADTPGSRMLITGTPKGKLNHLYQLAMQSEVNPEYSFHTMPTISNPFVPPKEVEAARLKLPERVFRQEFYASWEDFPGKIYTELDSANITTGKPDKFTHVTMGIDWGSYHPAISVLGKYQHSWYWLEGWSPGSERDSQPVPNPVRDTHIRRLAKKWRVNSVFCDPSQPSDILHVRELGRRDGHQGLQRAVEGYNRIAEGIGQVHSYISQKSLVFVPDLADMVPDAIDGYLGYQLHEAYHYETDNNGNIREVPADGYMSHIVDATRYALATKV